MAKAGKLYLLAGQGLSTSLATPPETKSKKVKKKKKRQELGLTQLNHDKKNLLFFKKAKVNKPLILIKMKIKHPSNTFLNVTKSLFACWSWNRILVTSQISGRKHHTRCHSK